MSSTTLKDIIAELPAERPALEKLERVLSQPGDLAWDADRLYSLIRPSSMDSLSDILRRLVLKRVLDSFVTVESPCGGDIDSFDAVTDIPDVLFDWRSQKHLRVQPDNIHVYFKRVNQRRDR